MTTRKETCQTWLGVPKINYCTATWTADCPGGPCHHPPEARWEEGGELCGPQPVSWGSQVMFHIGSSNSPQAPGNATDATAAPKHRGLCAPFGTHHSRGCTEHRIWLTLSWNFQGLTCIPQLVPEKQGHEESPPHALCTHQGQPCRAERKGRMKQAGAPGHSSPSGPLALDLLAGAQKAGIIPRSPPQTQYTPSQLLLPLLNAYSVPDPVLYILCI